MDGDKKTRAAESARLAYDEAQRVAEKDLADSHHISPGLALNFSVFQYEVWDNPDETCKMALQPSRMQVQSSTMSRGLLQGLYTHHAGLRDNLPLWTSDQEGGAEP